MYIYTHTHTHTYIYIKIRIHMHIYIERDAHRRSHSRRVSMYPDSSLSASLYYILQNIFL